MAKANLPTDFEDFEVAQNSVADEKQASEPQLAKDTDGVPYCREHHCRMTRTSGGAKGSPTAYFKCPVEGCECKAQMIKTKRESVVPSDPICCPRCSKPGKPVVCSRSKRFSTPASVVVQCPVCEWKSNALAVPNLAAQHAIARQMMRPEPMGIGDR